MSKKDLNSAECKLYGYPETPQSHHGKWRSANKRASNSVPQRFGFVRDGAAPRRHAASPVGWTTLRRSYEPHFIKNMQKGTTCRSRAVDWRSEFQYCTDTFCMSITGLNARKRSGIPKSHLDSGSPCTRRGAQRCFSKRVGRVSTMRPTSG